MILAKPKGRQIFTTFFTQCLPVGRSLALRVDSLLILFLTICPALTCAALVLNIMLVVLFLITLPAAIGSSRWPWVGSICFGVKVEYGIIVVLGVGDDHDSSAVGLDD